jgi:multiple sugar transport system substrate-binding protein
VQKYHVDDPKVQHDADAFAAGNTAMLFREAWVIGQIQKTNPNLDYGVAQIPAWTAGGPFKTLLQHNGINVSGKSRNQQAAWDFVKFLTNPQGALTLTQLSGWVSARQGVDWAPLLQKIPQYEVFLKPPANQQFYLEPVLSAFDEIESRLAEQLPAAYIDASLKDNPTKQAQLIHRWAQQTDQLLKDADLYGTT